jgi:hypothetical protein
MNVDRNVSLEVLESRQEQRLTHLSELQALCDAKQREIENVRATQRFECTVHATCQDFDTSLGVSTPGHDPRFARTHRFLEVVR